MQSNNKQNKRRMTPNNRYDCYNSKRNCEFKNCLLYMYIFQRKCVQLLFVQHDWSLTRSEWVSECVVYLRVVLVHAFVQQPHLATGGQWCGTAGVSLLPDPRMCGWLLAKSGVSKMFSVGAKLDIVNRCGRQLLLGIVGAAGAPDTCRSSYTCLKESRQSEHRIRLIRNEGGRGGGRVTWCTENASSGLKQIDCVTAPSWQSACSR